MDHCSRQKLSDSDWLVAGACLAILIANLALILVIGIITIYVSIASGATLPKENQIIGTAIMLVIFVGGWILLCTKPFIGILSSIVGLIREVKGLKSNKS